MPYRFRNLNFVSISVATLLLAGAPAFADTLLVPGEYATIQDAIDAANPGDVVELADGTYTGSRNKDLEFLGKDITVRSASRDPDLCIIDCELNGRGFHINRGEGPDAVIEGITVTNGYSHGDGGGVRCRLSDPTFINCTFAANIMWNYDGGGVACDQSNATFIRCRVMNNWASRFGGGIHCAQGSPTFIDCEVVGNTVWLSSGGGISCYESTPTFTNCRIVGNHARNNGGGVRCDGSDVLLVNCTISENSAYGTGGGVQAWGCNPTLRNCTISGNRAGVAGGGVFCNELSAPLMSNSLVWNNWPEEIASETGDLVVAYCNVQGGWLGTGNIDMEPHFVQTPDDGGDGWRDDPNTAELDESANNVHGDLHPLPGSPCIDAGDNAAVPVDSADLDGDGDTTEPLPFDLDRRPRLMNDPATPDTGNGTPPIVDIGAYEFQPWLGDVDNDGNVDLDDVNLLLAAYGTSSGDPDYNISADLDGDGDVDFDDLNLLLANYGT